MNTVRVWSANADYQKFEVLKTNRNKRYRYNEFLVEGVRNLNEAIKNGWDIRAFLFSREKPLSRWAEDILHTVPVETHYELSLPLIRNLSGKDDTSEIMAIVGMREGDPYSIQLSPVPLLALFDRPSNRGNLGTIIRSCDALGVDALLLTGHGVDIYDPEVVVSSMGSFFKVPVMYLADNNQVFNYIAYLKEKHPAFYTVGTTAHQELSIDQADLRRPLMFMIGNETDGLCHAFKENCDQMVTIPMDENSAATSFNVGCAATVMFYEAIRQRRK